MNNNLSFPRKRLHPVLLLRHEDGHIDREEQEADQRGRDPLHDGLLADGRLRLRHPHRRHQGHRVQREEERQHVPSKKKAYFRLFCCTGLHFNLFVSGQVYHFSERSP